MSEDLDTLLATPLPEVADNGFTRTVEARIAAEQARGSHVEDYAIAASLGLALMIAPFTPVGVALGERMEEIGGALLSSQTFAFVLLGLIATFVTLQFARDD